MNHWTAAHNRQRSVASKRTINYSIALAAQALAIPLLLCTLPAQAQLVSAYIEAPVNSWITNVTNGNFLNGPTGRAQALAADNDRNRIFASEGKDLKEVTYNVDGSFTTRTITVAILTNDGKIVDTVRGMGFGNGVIYASVSQSSRSKQKGGAPSGLYRLDPTTGVATKLFLTNELTIPVVFSGLDFNRENGLLYGISGKTIHTLNPQTGQVTVLATVPQSIYDSLGGLNANYDGLAVGGGHVYLTSGYEPLPIAVFNLEGVLVGTLPNPDRNEQTSGGATYLDALAGDPLLDPGPPKPPTSLSISSTTTGIRLNWTDNLENDFLEYGIYRSTDGTTFQRIGTSKVSDFTDSSTSTGTLFYYVTAIDKTGLESAPSKVVSITR